MNHPYSGAGVILIDVETNQVLFLVNKRTNQAEIPGGKVEPGDDGSIATAFRETREECGIDLTGHAVHTILDTCHNQLNEKPSKQVVIRIVHRGLVNNQIKLEEEGLYSHVQWSKIYQHPHLLNTWILNDGTIFRQFNTFIINQHRERLIQWGVLVEDKVDLLGFFQGRQQYYQRNRNQDHSHLSLDAKCGLYARDKKLNILLLHDLCRAYPQEMFKESWTYKKSKEAVVELSTFEFNQMSPATKEATIVKLKRALELMETVVYPTLLMRFVEETFVWIDKTRLELRTKMFQCPMMPSEEDRNNLILFEDLVANINRQLCWN